MTRVETWDVVHIIWNRQQWRADRGWYPYTGLYPHTDHLHTEVGESFNGGLTPRCAGGSAGCLGDCPKLKEFLVYLGGPHYLDPFPRLREEAGATTAFNLGSSYCRRVAGSTSWSNHAYGTAIDIGVRSITDGERVKAWLFEEEDEMTLDEIAQGLEREDAKTVYSQHQAQHEQERLERDARLQEMNRRLEGMNEFRDSLRDQSAHFLGREEYEAKHEALKTMITANTKAIDILSGQREGVSATGKVIGAVIGAMAALVTIATAIIVLSR